MVVKFVKSLKNPSLAYLVVIAFGSLEVKDSFLLI